jgi:hypothetical protein
MGKRLSSQMTREIFWIPLMFSMIRPSRNHAESSAIARMPLHVAQLESHTRRLAAQVRSERDRPPAGRIALLENSIDDMTSAIRKQAAAIRLWPKTRPPTSAALATAATASCQPRTAQQ